jgi:uncharacterized protein
VFLIAVVAWRHLKPQPSKPADRAFAVVGAASGLGSALLGSVGPLGAPFFLAYGFILVVEIGMLAAGAIFLIGL